VPLMAKGLAQQPLQVVSLLGRADALGHRQPEPAFRLIDRPTANNDRPDGLAQLGVEHALEIALAVQPMAMAKTIIHALRKPPMIGANPRRDLKFEGTLTRKPRSARQRGFRRWWSVGRGSGGAGASGTGARPR